MSDKTKQDILRLKCFIKNYEFFDELVKQYTNILGCIGWLVYRKYKCIMLLPEYIEIAEYLDGNNFIVDYPTKPERYIILRPQYSND